MNFNAQKYWAKHEVKVWVVTLIKIHCVSGKTISETDTKYVRARTEIGAIKTARLHTVLTGRISEHARLATPTDLECIPKKSGAY